MSTKIIVLGAYGEHIGSSIVRSCLTRENVSTFFLVRPGAEEHAEKRAKIESLVAAGATIVRGDASDVNSLTAAFGGMDIVISALGGWGDLLTAHRNVYAACKANGVKRVVPAQFGSDVLSFPEEDMDAYFKTKKQWCVEAIDSGIPYTIVSHGAFAQWLFSHNNFFIKHDTRQVLYAGAPDFKGWITTSIEDTARLTVDCCLDASMASKRVAIAGAIVSATDLATALTAHTGVEYTVFEYKSIEQCMRDAHDTTLSKQEQFNSSLLGSAGRGVYQHGFHEPYLVDTLTQFGWRTEGFRELIARLFADRAKAPAQAQVSA